MSSQKLEDKKPEEFGCRQWRRFYEKILSCSIQQFQPDPGSISKPRIIAYLPEPADQGLINFNLLLCHPGTASFL